MVDTSANVNTNQLTGTPEGTVTVPTHDCQSFLHEHTSKLAGLKSFHHLHFSSRHNFARVTSDGPEVDFNLVKDDWTPSANVLPECFNPTGHFLTRQWYLYQKIREFCPEASRDATCPRPSVPVFNHHEVKI